MSDLTDVNMIKRYCLPSNKLVSDWDEEEILIVSKFCLSILYVFEIHLVFVFKLFCF